MARPELFMEKYNTYTSDDSAHQRIDLHKNFILKTHAPSLWALVSVHPPVCEAQSALYQKNQILFFLSLQRDATKKKVDGIKQKYFGMPIELMYEQLERQRPFVKELIRLSLEFYDAMEAVSICSALHRPP